MQSAACTYGWKRPVPEAIVFVRTNPSPGSQIYNQVLQLTMGAGTHNVLRFYGLFRRYDYRLWPRALGLVFHGRLVRAAEYQNGSDPLTVGGLTLLDLLGSPTGTDADIVQAVLTVAGVSFSGANIGGTGVTFGSRALLTNFMWRAGTSTNPLVPTRAAGQTALAYIQEWDKASAVYTDTSSPVGFYRTYETVTGVYRALIGGRPRNSVDLTFSEGIDILPGAQSTREYPVANSAFVTGWDPGLGIGPVRFFVEGTNPLQDQTIISDYASPFIEWSSEAESGIGMNAERVGNALLADLNRETVTVRFRTPRDELVLPGYTILVQGPGGSPALLGIGENMWVDEVTTGVAEDGEFYQDITATGGGIDSHTGAPPG